jgi:hypothetical protein
LFLNIVFVPAKTKNNIPLPSLQNLTLGIVITVDDEHWIHQKWYLWQFPQEHAGR